VGGVVITLEALALGGGYGLMLRWIVAWVDCAFATT